MSYKHSPAGRGGAGTHLRRHSGGGGGGVKGGGVSGYFQLTLGRETKVLVREACRSWRITTRGLCLQYYLYGVLGRGAGPRFMVYYQVYSTLLYFR